MYPTLVPASLLPKLRDQYAEFLDHVSLVHLRLLASPTCVGLRYGRSRYCPTRLFSRVDSMPLLRGLPLSVCTPVSACAYAVGRPSTCAAGTSFHGPLVGHNVPEAGQEYSPAVHRLRLWGLALGSASPCADCHGAGILGLTVCGVFTRICAYSFRHPHFRSLQDNGSPVPSTLPERSPTPQTRSAGQASAGRLIPTILGAFPLDE